MTDPNSPEARTELETNEARIWIGEPVMGLWCSVCNLPSAWQAPIGFDLATTPSGSYLYGCTDCGGGDS